jgi:GTPase SAR1 family protein
MEDTSETSANALTCKIVLLGEAGKYIYNQGVGKTSIISRYTHNTFVSNNEPTVGASHASKLIHLEQYDKNLKFEVNLNNKIDLGHSRSRKISVPCQNILQRRFHRFIGLRHNKEKILRRVKKLLHKPDQRECSERCKF